MGASGAGKTSLLNILSDRISLNNGDILKNEIYLNDTVRVNDDNFGLKGALQAAIDATTINDTAINNGGGTHEAPKGVALSSPYLPIPANDRFPSVRSMSKTNDETKVTAALGAPGIVTQMDVLNSIGPNLTARSDTFVIRAYGEAYDNNGQSIGKAWIEVVAQRSTDYIALANEEPNIRNQFVAPVLCALSNLLFSNIIDAFVFLFG
jgi:hypothetical protein